MKIKLIKTLISALTLSVLMLGALGISPAFAQQQDLEVDFESQPLFENTNFAPGDAETRWVKVTNNTSDKWPIGIKFKNEYQNCAPGELSDALDIEIKEDGSVLQQGTLTWFCESGELYLSDLDDGAITQYDFSVTFTPEAGDDYQGKTSSFDFDIGFWGESIGGEIDDEGGSTGGGGGGAVLVGGLEIKNESASEITTTSVEITWLTTQPATSRVIYASKHETRDFDWKKPPNYGYPRSTSEDSTKKTGHSMDISGLLPGTTYYFRVVSHASPATISLEHSFTTLGNSQVGLGEDEDQEGSGGEDNGEGSGGEEGTEGGSAEGESSGGSSQSGTGEENGQSGTDGQAGNGLEGGSSGESGGDAGSNNGSEISYNGDQKGSGENGSGSDFEEGSGEEGFNLFGKVKGALLASFGFLWKNLSNLTLWIIFISFLIGVLICLLIAFWKRRKKEEDKQNRKIK